jgi:tRNA (mo5U34)-methyltransferase
MNEPRAWYHTIELPDGTATPGYFDTRAAPSHVVWPHSLRGGRCLDVGTFDGFWAFEMERRGAGEVVAIDVDDPTRLDWPYDRRRSGPVAISETGAGRGPGFREVAALLNSKVQRVVRSVYDLDPAVDGRFEVVLCGTLLLHLRDPVMALERMREVCAGSLVLVEEIDESLELLAGRIPTGRLHPEHDQWWRLNSAGICQAVRMAGFQVTAVGARFLIPLGPGSPPGFKLSLLSGLAARRPGQRGLLMRAVTAVPRPPADAEPSAGVPG